MEKFKEFGIEPILLLAQIVNFFLLLYLLKRFLYKPVLGMLRKREEKIREGLEAAAKGEQFLTKAKEEEKKMLVRAGEEASMILEETRVRVVKIEEELLTKAKMESNQMLVHARVQIEAEKKQAERDIERKVVDSAVSVLERVLPKVLSRADHMHILASSAKMLRKVVSS